MKELNFELFENIRTPVFIVQTNDHVITYVNSVGEDLIGQSKKQLMKRKFHELFSQIDKNRAERVVSNGLTMDVFDEYEIVMERKSKRKVIANLHCKVLSASDPQTVVVTVNDITDVVKKRQEAKAQKENFERLIRNIGESLILLDLNKSIIGINPSTISLFECLDDILGENVGKLFDIKNLFTEESEKEIFANEILPPKEIMATKTDGSTFKALVSVSLLKDEKGDASGYIVTSTKLAHLSV